MKEVSFLIIVCSLFFTIFGITIVLGLIKKSKNLKFIAVISLIIFVCLSFWTGNKVIKKASNKISEAFKPRTGEEIYNSLFDNPQNACVKIINYKDQVIPKVDYAIWLYFETCPSEFQRILAKHDFTNGEEGTANWNEKIPYGEHLEWANPKLLGETVKVYEYSTNNSKNIQTFWASLDSTKVICRDIAD